LREGFVCEIRKRRAAPESQGFAQRLCGLCLIAGGELFVPLLGQPFEAVEIHLGGLGDQHVAAIAGRHRVGAERLAQAGDVTLQRLRRSRGSLFAPELVDQAIARDNLAAMEDQDREQRALLRSPQREAATLVDHLQWPQYPKAQHAAVDAMGRAAVCRGFTDF
jgi:hypothetical protein